MSAPLRIAVIFHRGSRQAENLARHLFESLAAGPGGAGLRIPIEFLSSPDGTPPSLNVDAAAHTLAVVLVDGDMACRQPDSGPARRWADLVVSLLNDMAPDAGPHLALPVAVDEGAFDLDDRLERRSFIRLDHLHGDDAQAHLLFHVATAALRLIEGLHVSAEPGEDQSPAPVSLFISHAKGDLPADPGSGSTEPVPALVHELGLGPVDHWYDAKHIPAGGRFDDEIIRGVLRSSAMVAVVTNRYSSREWCRREILEAKAAGRPLLVIDHITDEEPRLFPYIGNAPVMRWKGASSASKAIIYAVCEALRYRHQVAMLQRRAEPGDAVLGTRPELLSVVGVPAETERVLYPDPPLGEEELIELRRARPEVRFTTPLSEVAAFQPPPGRELVALSLSTAQDAWRFGGSKLHLRTLSDDLNLYLLLAGFRIAYGGVIGHAALEPGEDNYTERLLELARSYSPLARQLGRNFEQVGEEGGQPIIVNYVGWPIHHRYGSDEYKRYGRMADMIRVPMPDPLGVSPQDLGVPLDRFFPPTDAMKRFAWARGMTALREAMCDTEKLAARIVMGGKLSGYTGRYPGVLEEALLDLRAGRPVFLVGALGGAARLVYDALRGEQREELTTRWVTGVGEDGKPRYPFYDEVRERHLGFGLEMKTPEELAEELANMGRSGLGSALGNGLSDTENEELSVSTDPGRIVELVLTGLRGVSSVHHKG